MNPTTCGPPCRKIHVMGPRTPRRARLKPARSVAVRSTSLDTARMLGEVLDTLDALKTVVITQAMSEREFPLPKDDYATDPQYKPKPDNRFPDEMDQISWTEREVSEVTPEPVEGPVSRWTCGGRDSYPSAPAALQIAAQGQPEGAEAHVEECADCGGWHTEPRHVEPMAERLCQKVRYATAQIAEAVKRVYEEIEPKCGTCGGFHLRNTRANR